MATYQINQKNTHFSGEVGDLIVMDPGEFAKAAVLSGILSRVDVEQAEVEEAEPVEETKKKK